MSPWRRQKEYTSASGGATLSGVLGMHLHPFYLGWGVYSTDVPVATCVTMVLVAKVELAPLMSYEPARVMAVLGPQTGHSVLRRP